MELTTRHRRIVDAVAFALAFLGIVGILVVQWMARHEDAADRERAARGDTGEEPGFVAPGAAAPADTGGATANGAEPGASEEEEPAGAASITSGEIDRAAEPATTAPAATQVSPGAAAPEGATAVPSPYATMDVAVAPPAGATTRQSAPPAYPQATNGAQPAPSTAQIDLDAEVPLPFDAAGPDAEPVGRGAAASAAPAPQSTVGAGDFTTEAPPDRASNFPSNPEAGAGPFTTEGPH